MAKDGRMVDFAVDGRSAGGYLVEGEVEAGAPALLVVHEWWGLNDHIKDITRRLGEEGYVALAPDLYDGKLTRDAEEAGRLMQSLDQSTALRILDGAVDYLKSHTAVDAGRIGITGFCMGGTFALLMAAHNESIKASAPFYGDVSPDEELEKLTAPILFIGAEQDAWITMDKMNRLKAALERFGKRGEVHIYNGVGHAFVNDTRPEAYNREAAKDAWDRVIRFFSETL